MSIKVNSTLVLGLAIISTVAIAEDKTAKKPAGHTGALQVVTTDRAPKPPSTFSQAIKAGGFVFTAGQLGRDPVTSKIEGDITAQTRRALENLSAVLTAAGTGMDRVVQARVFLTHMSDFDKMNEVYATYFKTNPPARTTVGVTDLRNDALIEIDLVALQ